MGKWFLGHLSDQTKKKDKRGKKFVCMNKAKTKLTDFKGKYLLMKIRANLNRRAGDDKWCVKMSFSLNNNYVGELKKFCFVNLVAIVDAICRLGEKFSVEVRGN